MTNNNNANMEELQSSLGRIENITKEDSHYLITYGTGESAKLNILNNHVFRYHMSPNGNFPDYPKPDYPNATAKITVKTDYNNTAFHDSELLKNDSFNIIEIDKIRLVFDMLEGLLSVIDKRSNKKIITETKPLSYNKSIVTQTLSQNNDEYFFGGGMQNGRFTHKGQVIEIVNTNKWTDGGVTSPSPFYWSTNGYGILRNTWTKGLYDFGTNSQNTIQTSHCSEDFDAFYFINEHPRDILNDYYELTGPPLFLPEYALYQSHFNAFNRDYWVKVSSDTKGAILFEDGFYYKCYQPKEIGDKGGVLESLNGEKNNYQFSARAMIDRYKKHDLPLGWFIPNDGYGSGYGQTDSLDGDIENLKIFGDYARENGVELAVWTESNLHPVDPEHPKKGDRDLNKEVSVAGVVALKADVAWIGSGYSFGLDAMQNASETFLKAANYAIRPMIITVDGWAGTQRCSGVWSGDQSGGEWEYIRFHIPTYIGSGLSGQPNIGSDMDGIYRGGLKTVNIRDYQWKAFTPLQLNMDGWGSIPKTPFAYDDEATGINRSYLKLKSMLLPYNYTISYESTHGLPMIRAMFLEFPNEKTSYTKDSQYQYMWGPNFLVAPIYNEDEDEDKKSIRNGIYLPYADQVWIDFFTGTKYQGGKIYNNFKYPLWKIPVFVKDGAIIPVCSPNNNPNEINRSQRKFYLYPNGRSEFHYYEDDGKSTDYLEKQRSITHIKMHAPISNTDGTLDVNIFKTHGVYQGIVVDKSTELIIMASRDVRNIKVAINGESLTLEKANTKEEYNERDNVYYFDEHFVVNPFLKIYSDESLHQSFLLVKISKMNILENEIHIKVKEFINKDIVFGSERETDDHVTTPAQVIASEITPTSIILSWNKIDEAIGYEIEKSGVKYYNIESNTATFDNLISNSAYAFRVRTVVKNGVSTWSNVVDVTTGIISNM